MIVEAFQLEEFIVKNQIIMLTLVIGAGATLTACGNSSAVGDTHQAPLAVVKHKAPIASNSQQYGLVDVHYSSNQINEMKHIAMEQGVNTAFAPIILMT